MIKVIATDLDGTLFYPKRKLHLISKKNKQFLQNALESGKRNNSSNWKKLSYRY